MGILDYLHWRSDLSFDERPYNEVDSLVFCALGYELLDEIFEKEAVLTIDEVAERFFATHDEEDLKKRLSVSARSYQVLKAMWHTKRYGKLLTSGYVNEIDHDLDLQFSAMTLINKGKWKVVVFRGTDDTITGWKEDFSMLYRKEVLAQNKAVAYLNGITKDESVVQRVFGKTDLYVTGHSKGGNLAMYACAHLNESVQKRVRRIDNFDGPGFRAEIWESEGMKACLPKIRTYLPSGSFFGRMFENASDKIIVSAKKRGLLQHDPYNWNVNVDQFETLDFLEESADKAIAELNELIGSHSEEEMEEIVESVFALIRTLEMIKLSDAMKLDFTKLIKALKELGALDSKTKKVLIELAGLLLDLSL